jgi:hypothetical protein
LVRVAAETVDAVAADEVLRPDGGAVRRAPGEGPGLCRGER